MINAYIQGSYVRLDGKLAGIQGESMSRTLRLNFSPEWGGLTKRILWLDARGKQVVSQPLVASVDEVVENNGLVIPVKIPGEALQYDGKTVFIVEGADENGAISLSAMAEMTVNPNDFYGKNAINATEPTPTEMQQLQASIEEAIGVVAADKQAAQAAAAAAAKSEAAAEDAAGTAIENANMAGTYANQARAAASTAERDALAANGAADKAETAKAAAQAAQAAVEAAKSDAENAAFTAAQRAENAAGAAQSAENAAGAAQDDAAAAVHAAQEAADAINDARAAAGQASDYAKRAFNYANDARSGAEEASSYARRAETAEDNAEQARMKAEQAAAAANGIPIPESAEVGQIIQVAAVDENGKPTAWAVVDMPKGEVTADSLSLTINPTDGKIYITVNGVMVGQGVTAGPPASFGDVQVDNLILKLNNGQSVTFNVRLSEPPTNPQVVTILSDSEHITFDKSKLTFTAENYDTYQTVTASAENVTEDGTAQIIIRNSDELMTDSFITVYLKAEFYNVDTTIPTEGQHIVTMSDFESSSAYGNYIRLYNYIGEYDNIVIPSQLDGKIPWICVSEAPTTANTTFLATGTPLKYVTFEDGVIYRGAGVTTGCRAGSLFKGFTSLIGVSNMNPAVTTLTNAFSGCTALKFIDNLHELTNVTALNNTFFESGIEYLPDLSGMVAVTTMETWVKNCTSLKRVYGMPVPATSCNTNQLFNGCTALEKAEVPQNATTMFYCFNDCTSLREVTVHATGITTGTSAFNNCTNLTVYLDADTTTYETLTGLYGSSTNVIFITDGGASAPSIVVWGDSTSSPNRTWKEWPARLQEAVSTYLVKNQAASGEFTTSTSARQGGNALSGGAFTIPADTSAVGITLKSADGHTFGADPVFSAAHSFNPCTISGVKGTINHAGGGVYNFTRLTAGEAVDVTEGAVITSDADDLLNNADAVMLVNIGINSGWDEDADVLLNQVQLMVDHFTAKGGTKYIITGPYAGQFLLTDEIRQTVFSYEEKAATAFGEHWLNLREYLIENGLTENGLTATATDTERMALGQIPGSLLGGGSTTDILMYPDTSSDQTHPNTYGQNSIFNAFYNKGVALGYWT